MPSTFTLPAPTLTKIAAGDSQTFENSLATIGRSFLSPKAPGLFQHEIGFQVLDQDDDNTRAVGVFGFRIGSRLCYVPMFYRDGTVKGTEQLRDPKRKVTVPLSDNWVNKFLSDGGEDPPERTPRSPGKDTALPSLWQLRQPPSKYAADKAMGELVGLAKKDLAAAITGSPRPPAPTGLDLLKEAAEHPALMAGVDALVRDHHWFRSALLRFHGAEKVAAAADAAARKAAPRAADPRHVSLQPAKAAATKTTVSRVTVIRVRTADLEKGPGLSGLDYDPEALFQLREGRNAYTDTRREDSVGKVTTWVGGVTAEGERLQNPDHDGVYEVLGPDFEYTPCVVLTKLVGWTPPVAYRVLVYRPSDGAWTIAHRNAVWVRGEAGGLNPDRESGDHGPLIGWAEKLKKVEKEIPSGTHAAICVLNPNQVFATVPFHAYSDGEASTWEADSLKWPRGAPSDPRASDPAGRFDDPRGTCGPRRVEVFPDRGPDRPVVSGDQLYVPAGCGLVSLDGPRLRLGDGAAPERALFAARKRAGDRAVSVEKVASGWVVRGPAGVAKYAYPENAEAALVVSHALRVDDARKLVEVATAHKKAECLVKYADPRFGLAHNAPVSPNLEFDQIGVPASFADDIIPTEAAASAAIPINDMLQQPQAPDRYRPYPQDYGTDRPLHGIGNGYEPAPASGPTEDDLRAVSDMAQSGRKELFDTAALAALVKHTRLQTLLDKVRGKMLKVVTDLGDLLAHMYWNTDEWSEQFGQAEIGPLEDQVRSQFEGLGELVLTLQEKAVGDGLDTGILPDARPADGADASK